MKVTIIKTKKEILKFIKMQDKLYKNDTFYVPFMKADLYKTLKRLILKEKTYTALAVVDDKNNFIARVLITIGKSKQLKIEKCGFFSHFESINNQKCINLLFDEAIKILKWHGATYLEGPYFLDDPDNRRGIQISGFKDEPMILTSYNHPYYQELLENYGFTKDFDTVSYTITHEDYNFERVEKLKAKLLNRYDLRIDPANFNNIDYEISSVHSIMRQATNNIIFDDAPTVDELTKIFKGWKSFLYSDYILIIRRKSDLKPIGFLMAIPNFYTIFRKMKGKITPITLIKLLYYKTKITSMRIILQYVIPEYQNKGINYLLYHELYKYSKLRKVNYIEVGTIMENNKASRINVENAGAKLNKIFRIYGKKI